MKLHLYSCYLQMIYDDMVIVGKDRNDLQRSLDLLNSSCNKWELAVNTEKN